MQKWLKIIKDFCSFGKFFAKIRAGFNTLLYQLCIPLKKAMDNIAFLRCFTWVVNYPSYRFTFQASETPIWNLTFYFNHYTISDIPKNHTHQQYEHPSHSYLACIIPKYHCLHALQSS
jgi:hypothetical protein